MPSPFKTSDDNVYSVQVIIPLDSTTIWRLIHMFKLKTKFQKLVFITIALGASVVSFSQQRPPNPVPCFGIGVGVCEQAQENTYYVSTSGDNEAAGGFNIHH